MDSGAQDSSDGKGSARREFVRRTVAITAGAASLSGGNAAAQPGVRVAGSDAPEKTELRVGFVPLTDCASVVLAATEGFDRRHGIRIVLSREPSWASVRDKLLNGELDAAQCLYGLVLGTHLGTHGIRREMAALMTLSQNGQGITLSRQLQDAGVHTGAALAARIRTGGGRLRFAHTFPGGTHALWLAYWLAAHGIDPLTDVDTTVIAPPRMVAGLREHAVDGFCAGEPWNARAVFDRVGFTVATSQDVWPDHPEKILGCTADFVDRHPHAARALVMSVLEASRFLDERADRQQVAQGLADPAYVNAPAGVIGARFAGEYDDGNGRRWTDPHALRFHEEGRVNFPWLSDALWFLTQQRRWGLIPGGIDYMSVARAVNRVDLYAAAAGQIGVAVPREPMRRSVLMDGVAWDGTAPETYAQGFAIHA